MGGIRKRPAESTIFHSSAQRGRPALLFASSGWKRGNREGMGVKKRAAVVFYRGASYYGASRAPFARQASTGAVIYRMFLAFLVYEAH